jgi:hypothetical protein
VTVRKDTGKNVIYFVVVLYTDLEAEMCLDQQVAVRNTGTFTYENDWSSVRHIEQNVITGRRPRTFDDHCRMQPLEANGIGKKMERETVSTFI